MKRGEIKTCEWAACRERAVEMVGERGYCRPHAQKVRRIRDAKFTQKAK